MYLMVYTIIIDDKDGGQNGGAFRDIELNGERFVILRVTVVYDWHESTFSSGPAFKRHHNRQRTVIFIFWREKMEQEVSRAGMHMYDR